MQAGNGWERRQSEWMLRSSWLRACLGPHPRQRLILLHQHVPERRRDVQDDHGIDEPGQPVVAGLTDTRDGLIVDDEPRPAEGLEIFQRVAAGR